MNFTASLPSRQMSDRPAPPGNFENCWLIYWGKGGNNTQATMLEGESDWKICNKQGPLRNQSEWMLRR